MGSITDSEHQGDASTKRTYRVNEVAKILGVSNATAYRLIKEGHFRTVLGKIGLYNIGSSIRVSRQSFDEWLDSKSD